MEHSREPHFSVEEAIRKRHAFEDRVKIFLEMASIMTNREIEVALGRLADIFTTDEIPAHVQIRGEILKLYYDLRLGGIRKYRSFKRQWSPSVPGLPPADYKAHRTLSDHLISSLVTFRLLSDNCLAAPPSSNQQPLSETVKLLSH
jgi:hypothetical protein